MPHARRIARLRAAMEKRGLDAVLITQPHNVYYLSNFRPMMWNLVQPFDDPEGFVLVERDRVSFICDD
ncbi:MAG: aminopeptidase P family N-terminal domain-containing protein, partial [Phycisphaerae bacterium]